MRFKNLIKKENIRKFIVISLTFTFVVLNSTNGFISSVSAETISESNEVINSEVTDPTSNTAVTPNFVGSVTFVSDGVEKVVNFTSGDDILNQLDEKGKPIIDESDKGGGTSKKYFVVWAKNKNYSGGADTDAYYSHQKISDVFPDGLKGGEKLYAIYLSATSALSLSSTLSGGNLDINRYISDSDTLPSEYGFLGSENNIKSFYTADNIGEKVNINLGLSYHIDPLVNAIIRRSNQFEPGSVEYYGNTSGLSTATSINNMAGTDQYTYFDFYFKVDDRIELNNELDFTFKSYSLKPHMILKNKKDITGKNYEKFDNVDISVGNNSSESTIRFSPGEEKEFIIRTRIRHKSQIPNATYQEAISDLQLISNKEDNFTVSRQVVQDISVDKSEPLVFKSYTEGGAKLYQTSIFGFKIGGPSAIKRTNASNLLIDFKYNQIEFNKNTSALGIEEEQNIGTVNVVHNKSVNDDSLTDESMPSNPGSFQLNGKTYEFKGWNTKSDGTGEAFDGNSVVSENTTLYAVWGMPDRFVKFDKNTVKYGDDAEQNLGTVKVEDHSSIDNDKFDNELMPSNPEKFQLNGKTYEFKEWNTKSDGTGEVFDGNTNVLENITVYALWTEKIENKPTNGTDSGSNMNSGSNSNSGNANGTSISSNNNSSQNTNSTSTNDILRISGANRESTSIEISKKYYDKSKTVVLVNGNAFSDSITSTVLARQLDAPILLTNKDDISSDTLNEIRRLGANRVIIIGGENSISKSVENSVSKITPSINRLSGEDRYATSVEVARSVFKINGNKGIATIASGEVFADALSISPFSAKNGYPILLVQKNDVPDSVSKSVDEFKIDRVYLVGGNNTISDTVKYKLPNVLERISGEDRYATSVEIAKSKFSDSKLVFLGSGEVFADALVIGPIGAKYNKPILLTPNSALPKSVDKFFESSKINDVTVIGGASSISESVLNRIKQIEINGVK